MKQKVYTGPLREYKQQAIYVGGLLGETNSNSKNKTSKYFSFYLTFEVTCSFAFFIPDNTTKIFYGLLKEPELNILDENDESLADGEEGEKPKVKYYILQLIHSTF